MKIHDENIEREVSKTMMLLDEISPLEARLKMVWRFGDRMYTDVFALCAPQYCRWAGQDKKPGPDE